MARIELRIVGIRSIGSTVPPPFPGKARQKTPAIAKPRILPPMRIAAGWNGDLAAVVDFPACDVGDAIDRPMSSFPAARDSCTFGDDTSDGFIPLGRDAVRRRAEQPRLVVLPMHVPSIMKTTETKKSRDGRQLAGTRLRRGGNRSGHGADTCDRSRRVKMSDGGFNGANGGCSHCLRVTIAANPAPTSGHTASGTFPTNSADVDDVNNKTEARFFERDLLREEWTQILVPVPLGGHSTLFDCPNLNSGEGGIRPGVHSSAKNTQPRWKSPSKQHQNGHQAETSSLPPKKGQHGDQSEASPEVFVVLQARAAGFHPSKPPLWLVRRDFAERAVRRIVSAAAAAVVQPRVEVTLLGLRGAVDSLLMPETESEKGHADRKIAVHHQKGSSLPTLNERELDGGREEILCQAFWNGKLAHSVRLHRSPPPHPRVERSRPAAISHDGAFHPSNETRTLSKSRLEGASVGGNGDGYPGVSVPLLAAEAAGGDNCDAKHTIAGIAGGAQTDDRDIKSKDQDPTSWFSNDGLSHLESWVSVGTPPQNETLPEGGEGERDLKHSYRGAHNTTNVQGLRRPGTSAKQHGTVEKRHHHTSPPPPLAWTPAEANTCSGRPIHFFFPASLFDDAATNTRSGGGRSGISGRPKVGLRNVPDRKITEGGSSSNDDGGWGIRGDDAAMDESSGAEGTTVRGDLRLVFWLVSSAPTSSKNGVHAVGAGRTRSVSNSRGGAAAVVSRKLIGCARLIDDELVLQPPGERVELALSRSAGLDTPEEWAMPTNKPTR